MDEYYCKLSLEQRIEYFKKYDLGKEWKDRDNWFYDLFDGNGIDGTTDEEYERIVDKVFGNK